MYNVSEAYSKAVAKQSRCWRLGGNITLASRTEIALTDRNVMDMQIESQMTNGSASEDSIELGSVYASMLTMQIHDGSGADSFADAMIQPFVGLQLSDGSYEDIPMGIFYVNAASIKRVKDIVTFCAYDKMIFLQYLLTPAMRTTMSGFSVYTASAYLCAMVGLQLAQEQSDVESFPNSDIPLSVSDERIETARDVIMWCAQMMGCYARIDRFGRLEYVQIKAENDEATGMIIPVREIKANQRFDTKFADGVLRITSLTMKKNDGKYVRAHITMTAENKRSMELELNQNPLLMEQSVRSVGEALKAILKVIKTAYFRPFNAEIASDPALDAGDYVRLRGGNIDTSRGYATGMITHNVWRYRGHHDIVNVGAVPVISQLDSTAALAELSDTDALSESSEDDISGDVDGEEIVYVTPKKQSEKGQASQGGSSSGAALTEYEYISDSSVKYNGVTYSVEKNDNGLISRISDDNGNDFKPTVSGGISDVTLHNAVFWALAMHSGISRNYYDDTLTPMVQYRYNVGRYTASGADIELLNQADGAALPLVFEGATLNSDNVYIIGNPNSRGYIDYTAPAGELNECTTYLVAKGATTNALRFSGAPSTHDSYGVGEGFSSNYGRWCAGTQANATLLSSAVSITSISVLVLRHVGDTLHFYVNGKYIGVCPTPAIPVTAGRYWMGITAGMYYDGGGYHYYDFAFAESAHSEVDVIKNSKYLMYKYGVK